MKLDLPIKFLLATIFVLLATSFLDSVAASDDDPKLAGTVPTHWRVVWTSDPAHRATISWSTATPASKYVLKYRVKNPDPNETTKFSTLAAESGQFTGGDIKLCFYHARLSELQPSTAYEIQIVSDQNVSPLMFFVTAPDHDRPFSLLSGGDSRTDHDERVRANELISKMVSDSLNNSELADDIIAIAHGGDYVATGTNLTQWNRWLSDYEHTLGADGQLLPIIPARGNHDNGEIFNQVFGFPAKDTNYYAINLGPQVRMVTLNTEISTAGAQAKWLGNELNESRPKNRWLFAQYHRPAYPSVKTPGTALQSWVPIFDRHNLDLACELDGHTIKRTVPIRGNVQDPTGVVYIGEGGLGVEQRTPKTERWYLQPPGMTTSGSHVFVLTFEKEKLSGKCVKLQGEIADQFTLLPRKLKTEEHADPKPAATPEVSETENPQATESTPAVTK